MAKKFLQEVAEFITTKYKGDNKDLVVIVPNRRAGLFLEKYLQSRVTKTVWSPLFYSIEDFVFETTKYHKASSTDLVFELYEIYLKHNSEEKQSFDDFSSWGPRLIKDFNDIDSYLTDYEVVFSYLMEARNLQKWNLDRPELTNLEKNFLQFYNNLKTYYLDFKAKLRELNSAYSGMAIRELIDRIWEYDFKDKHFIIAGFNALTAAEERLFEHLVVENNAKIFWDVDDYYMNDFKQEAGRHIRKNIKNSLLEGTAIMTHGFKEAKHIRIDGLTGDYAMIKYVGQILENLIRQPNFDPNDTAIVLADEELLFPLLNSLPKEIDELNITMSFPYKKSEAYDLIIRIIDLYNSAARMNKTGQKTTSISLYYKSIQKLLSTSLLKKIYGESIKQFLRKLQKENLMMLTFEQAIILADESGMKDSNPWTHLNISSLDAKTILQTISNFLSFIVSKIKSNYFDQELLHLNQNIINQLLKKVENHDIIENISTLKNLFKTLTSLKGIPFEGRPLAGLQIMGVLETRALDFKNIIYISFNEGIIPHSTQFKSFILPEIRREFKLPMPIDDDAIMSYHFYRSIQRAKNISLIYNSSTDNMGGGEVSRFAMQLAYELKDKYPEIHLQESTVGLPKTIIYPNPTIEIKKTEEIYERLIELGTNKKGGFSPTSLTSYIGCSLKFYFNKILNINTVEEIEEEMATKTRGNVIHGVLETLFLRESMGNNKFDKDFYDRALNDYPAILEAEYKKHFSKGDINHGNNLLLKTLDSRMIKKFIIMESKNSLGISEVECEKKIETFYQVKAGDKHLNIRVHGSADRIDYHNGIKRIIDYKTGKVNTSELNLDGTNAEEKWDNMFKKNKYPKAFQLLSYTLIYNRMHNYEQPILPLIASLKAKTVYFKLQAEGSVIIKRNTLDKFEEDLIALLHNIYDKDNPFKQTEDLKTCQYCDYKTICNRD